MAFDKDKPASSTSLRDSNPQILANWAAIETALNREHEFSTGGTVADQAHHKRGSARAFFQDGEPATRVDGTAFTSEDLGSLWFDSNSSPDNQFYVLTATTPTWTPVSTEIIATLLASARVFGSTLGVTGETTLSGGLAATTMNGALAMGSNPITGLEAANATGEAVHFGQWKFNNVAAAVASGSDFAEISTTLPNGTILKSGRTGSIAAGATSAVSFNTAFPNAIFTVQLTAKRADDTDAGTVQYGNESVSGFTIYKPTGTNTATNVSWFAIGR